MEQQGNAKAVALKRFKGELVDLLRDTLGLPMPRGGTKGGAYDLYSLGADGNQGGSDLNADIGNWDL